MTNQFISAEYLEYVMRQFGVGSALMVIREREASDGDESVASSVSRMIDLAIEWESEGEEPTFIY